MKALEKIELVKTIGRELQSRMTFDEIDIYFHEYGIPTNREFHGNSKFVYVKDILSQEKEEMILKIADELEISHNYHSEIPVFKENTATFWKPGFFKLFISHLSDFKVTITHLKLALEKYGISAFVAHEDIEPAKEWQDEIEKGLFTMDALCAVLMPGFKESNWTDQEIGVAIGRGVLVIPIRRELDPYGFIGKYQGYQAKGKNIEQVAEGIFQIIVRSPKTRNRIISVLVDLLCFSQDKIDALERLKSIEKVDDLPKEILTSLRMRVLENQNLKQAEVIRRINEILTKSKVENIKASDFEKKYELDGDDLPF
jgi:hypothetical protein